MKKSPGGEDSVLKKSKKKTVNREKKEVIQNPYQVQKSKKSKIKKNKENKITVGEARTTDCCTKKKKERGRREKSPGE